MIHPAITHLQARRAVIASHVEHATNPDTEHAWHQILDDLDARIARLATLGFEVQ